MSKNYWGFTLVDPNAFSIVEADKQMQGTTEIISEQM